MTAPIRTGGPYYIDRQHPDGSWSQVWTGDTFRDGLQALDGMPPGQAHELRHISRGRDVIGTRPLASTPHTTPTRARRRTT